MIRVERLSGAALAGALEEVARLRIAVFRDWPYLYDGDREYEQRYLANFAESGNAVLVGAFDGDTLVGAATAAPMADHAEDFAEALKPANLPVDKVFYLAESVLLPEYRGQGIGHRFFDLREMQGYKAGAVHAVFCSVIRSDRHPLKPADYSPLDGFWASRGYAPLPGCVARFAWPDIGHEHETEKPLQLWGRRLC